MGEFLADVCCVIDPQRVVLGGGVSAAGQQLLDGIAPNFHRFMFHACRGTEFALATLGNAAGIYGAASLFRFRPLMRKKRAALLSFWKRSAFFRFFSPQGPFYSAEIRK